MDETLEIQVGELLTRHHFTISTAESCTGGLIAHRLTNISGSSAYVIGGAVTYSNEAKMKLLGVQESTLIAHGAVSEPTAAEMALGARQLFGTTISLSVTGIAGPGGGTATKPVGLTFIGMAAEGLAAPRVIKHVWNGDRVQNKEQSAEAALSLLLDYLKSL